MKRSATLSIIAMSIVIGAMPLGCSRSSEPGEPVAAKENANDLPVAAPPVGPARDLDSGDGAATAQGDLRVGGSAAGDEIARRPGKEQELVPIAPREAAAGADPIETPPSGFGGRREPWREQLVGATKPLPDDLTAEIVDACLEVARDIDPALADRFALLREKNPGKLEATLRKTERLYALALLKQRDSSLYQLKLIELNVDREISRLTKEYRDALLLERDPGDIEQQLRMQIRLQLAFQFRNREDHLCKLQELIEQLEIEFEAEKAYLEEHADDVVEERLREIINAVEPPPPE